jgi:hypothetical protein
LKTVFSSLPLLQFAQDAALAGLLAVVQPIAMITLVAVGACGIAAELADGQLLPAAATDQGLGLSLGVIAVSHRSISFLVSHSSFFTLHSLLTKTNTGDDCRDSRDGS